MTLYYEHTNELEGGMLVFLYPIRNDDGSDEEGDVFLPFLQITHSLLVCRRSWFGCYVLFFVQF